MEMGGFMYCVKIQNIFKFLFFYFRIKFVQDVKVLNIFWFEQQAIYLHGIAVE